MADIPVGVPPAALPLRPRTMLVGTVFATAGVLMYFATLLGVYLRERSDVLSDGGEWIPSSADIQLAPPTVAAWTMLLSVVTMQWAVYSIARDDRPHAIMAISLTTLFGLAVIVQTSFQYTEMGLVSDESVASVLIYIISGSHLVMIIAGLVFLFLVTFRALGGQYSSRQTDGFVAASIFWYAIVFVYVVIWAAIFVLK